MLKPSRLSLYLSFLIPALAFWLMRSGASAPLEAIQAGKLFITHVNVYDPGAPGLQLDRQVLISDGLIQSISPASSEIPKSAKGARLIDAKDKTLLPGLIDTAAFASLDGCLPDDRRATHFEEVLRFQLQAGVTCLLDYNASRAQIRDAQLAEAPLRYPRLRVAAAFLTSPGGWRPGVLGDGSSPCFEIANLEDLELAFKSNREDGASLIIASVEHDGRDGAGLSPELLARLGQLCQNARLPLCIHVEHPSKVSEALQASPQILAGCWASEKVEPALIAALLKSGCAYAPGLQSLMGFQPPHEITAGLRAMAEPGWISVSLIDSLGNWGAMLKYSGRFEQAHASGQIAAENVAALAAAGVPILLGSFAGMPGLPHGVASRVELGRLVDSGLSPEQVLKAATLNAARALSLNQLGRVAPGFIADLLLVEADPSKDLNALRKPYAVIRAGKYWSSIELAKP